MWERNDVFMEEVVQIGNEEIVLLIVEFRQSDTSYSGLEVLLLLNEIPMRAFREVPKSITDQRPL